MAGLEQNLRKILKRELLKKQKKNSNYSLRAFARDLQVSPSTISRLLASKSNLSRPMLNSLIKHLKLSAEEKTSLIRTEVDPWVNTEVLNEDVAMFVKHWYYSPLACLAETAEFKEDPIWIAHRLGIKVSAVRPALKRLERIGLLTRNSEGQLIPSNISISTRGASSNKNKPDPNLLSKNKLVERNIKNLDPFSKSISDVSSVVFATDLKRIPEAKNRIKTFRRNLSKYLDAGNKQEVYLLFIQLIPLSKLDRK